MKKELIENNKILKWENRKLQLRIDKAIEYIEHEWFKRCQLGITDRTFYECDMNGLLEILKGEDKE